MERPLIHVAIRPQLVDLLFTADDRARLERIGELVVDAGRPGAELVRRAPVLVTGWGTPQLPRRLPDDSPLRLIAHSAGSVRSVIPRSLLADGVRATQAAAAMADAVAEFALTLCLCLLRHVHTFDRAMVAAGDWSVRDSAGLGRAFSAQRVGVIGAGRTGRSFIGMARALGATVDVFDPYLSAEAAGTLGVGRIDLDALMRASDLLVVHAPVTPQTRGMVGARELALLRDGAILVNTARSAVIDEPALVAELVSGRLRAGLDVFDDEPLPHSHPLVGLPNVLITPHQAGATVQARRLQGRITADEISRFVQGEPLRHEVTAETYDRLA